jgi:hypothetical protein
MGRQVVGGLKRPWSIIIWFVWDENPNWQVGLRSSSTKQTIDNLKISSGWWFGAVFFSHILGISSPQLTFTPSFFRGVGQPPTRNLRNAIPGHSQDHEIHGDSSQ